MNKAILGACILVLSGLSVAYFLIARKLEDYPRVGIVDNAQIMAQFSESVQAQKEINNLELDWKRNAKTIKDSLQGTIDSLSKKYERAGMAERKAMQERLNYWNGEYTRYSAAVERMRPEKQKELLNPILEKINGFVKNWAFQNGYDVILGTGNGGVILAANQPYNVTNRVLQDLNKLYVSTSPQNSLATPDKPAGK